jgi:type 1 glutamine amidotransferase
VKKALIVWGGWHGHEPEKCAHIVRDMLRKHAFDVRIETQTSVFEDPQLDQLDLIVPIYTMSKIEKTECANLTAAVRSGVGLAGFHGGMCDAFRDSVDYQFMTGGQWVAHPGGIIDFRVNITRQDDPVMQGLSDFDFRSEQYYMHVDPAVHVLATTRFPVADGPHLRNGVVDMPVVWTKWYGNGRVSYNGLGHDTTVVSQPEVLRLLERGCLWAAGLEN